MIGSLVYQGPAFTTDKNRLRSAMDLVPRDPASPVWFALDRAAAALRSESNRRVIVIYTDGRNDPGRFTTMKGDEAAVRARIESEGVMVYAIGFEGVSLGNGMKTIARRSGGRATELGRQDDLASALTAVADELHHQYLLGFTPAAFDGVSHQIEVRVRREGLTVRARQSHVAVRAPVQGIPPAPFYQ
jgi:hypothetical protein